MHTWHTRRAGVIARSRMAVLLALSSLFLLVPAIAQAQGARLETFSNIAGKLYSRWSDDGGIGWSGWNALPRYSTDFFGPPAAVSDQAGRFWVVGKATDGGLVYSDLHGHDPAAGQEFFVRYREDQEGATEATGSLVAPFDGEHGWYWLNIHDGPVTITLTVTGFFDDIVDYGIF